MISLITLRHYLQTKQRVSLSQLTQHFAEEDSVLEGMIHYFIRKGQVRQCQLTCSACKHCALNCVSTAPTIFEWVV